MGNFRLSTRNKDLIQRKKLTANHTGGNDTVVSEFTFNNLEVGKIYKFNANVQIAVSAGAGLDLVPRHNGKLLTRLRMFDSDDDNIHVSGEYTFTAESSVLDFVVKNHSPGASISGDQPGFENNSYVELEELKNHEFTTKWT